MQLSSMFLESDFLRVLSVSVAYGGMLCPSWIVKDLLPKFCFMSDRTACMSDATKFVKGMEETMT